MNDLINHPEHYTTQGGKEVIEHIFDCDFNLGFYFCLGNIIKYETRAMFKGDPEGDFAKAKWYFQHLMKILDKPGCDRTKNYLKQIISDTFRSTRKVYPELYFRIMNWTIESGSLEDMEKFS